MPQVVSAHKSVAQDRTARPNPLCPPLPRVLVWGAHIPGALFERKKRGNITILQLRSAQGKALSRRVNISSGRKRRRAFWLESLRGETIGGPVLLPGPSCKWRAGSTHPRCVAEGRAGLQGFLRRQCRIHCSDGWRTSCTAWWASRTRCVREAAVARRFVHLSGPGSDPLAPGARGPFASPASATAAAEPAAAARTDRLDGTCPDARALALPRLAARRS